ncbi:MAG: tetratricopeptide repeat protein [Magnetococcales bacterium]|nr:tetratricopeptide repeat protein [Magnetococcales bacterium]
MNKQNTPKTDGQSQLTIDDAYKLALHHFNAQDYTESDRLCTAIIKAAPNRIDAINLLGLIAQKYDRHDLAVEQFKRAIYSNNKIAQLYYNLGTSLSFLGQTNEAITAQKKAIEIQPDYSDAHYNLGNILLNCGKFKNAVESYKNAILSRPDFIEAFSNLGITLQKLGKQAEAVEIYQKAIAIKPDIADTHYNLGVAHQEQNQFKKAITSYSNAIAIKPEYTKAYYNLGNALHKLDKHKEAASNYLKAISIKPDFAEAHFNLANIFQEQNKLEDAVNSYLKAITIKTDYVEAYFNLGNTKLSQAKTDEAVECYNSAISLKPDFADAYSNLGNALHEQGKYEDAVISFQKAREIKPQDEKTHSNLIFCIDLSSDINTDLFYREREKWNRQHAEPLQKSWSKLNNQPDPLRKLRIGYVGADFCQHSAAFIFGPMILNYNSELFQVHCYAGNTKQDNLTNKFQEKSTGWLFTSKMDDAALADRIREDGIDILVDLAGHTKGNRLLTFARKPAPVQVTAWGYPHGTNMKAMDYLFADPIFLPLSERHKYSEEIIDIPSVIHLNSDIIFPEINKLPLNKNGYITFGAFNRIEKYNPAVYKLWTKILQNIPTAKLLIKTARLDSKKRREELLSIFSKLGVSSDRLILIGKTSRQDHLNAHNEIDIMLDPFPHNSGMTSLESLRMGVPVLTFETKSRCPTSASILNKLGLDEWRVRDEKEYIDRATYFANDNKYLKTLRTQLRARFDDSVLGNSKLYVAEIENIYRKLWKKWCSKETS